jgi:hypothetical protein
MYILQKGKRQKRYYNKDNKRAGETKCILYKHDGGSIKVGMKFRTSFVSGVEKLWRRGQKSAKLRSSHDVIILLIIFLSKHSVWN